MNVLTSPSKEETLENAHSKHGESFDDFLVALRELVKTCNYCSNVLDGDTPRRPSAGNWSHAS